MLARVARPRPPATGKRISVEPQAWPPRADACAMAGAMAEAVAGLREAGASPAAGAVARGAAAWAGLFLALRWGPFRARSAAFSNRVVSLLHAAVVLAIAAPAIRWAHPFAHYGHPATPQEARLCCSILGRLGPRLRSDSGATTSCSVRTWQDCDLRARR